jgi:hypothetical protein
VKTATQPKSFVRPTGARGSPVRPAKGGAADFAPAPLLYHCKNAQILKTSLRTALVVGTVLGVINHFDGIIKLSLTSTEIFQIVITYLVPFSVATYCAARHAQFLEGLTLSKDASGKPIGQGVQAVDRASACSHAR